MQLNWDTLARWDIIFGILGGIVLVFTFFRWLIKNVRSNQFAKLVAWAVTGKSDEKTLVSAMTYVSKLFFAALVWALIGAIIAVVCIGTLSGISLVSGVKPIDTTGAMLQYGIIAAILGAVFRGVVWPISEYLWKHLRVPEKQKRLKFLSIPIPVGLGNQYFGRYYIDPPVGNNVKLEGVEFQLSPRSFVFDTNEGIHLYFPREDGSREINLKLEEPVRFVKSVYVLINSGNSKGFYKSRTVGAIELIFKDAPPVNTALKLGKNIREWCVGAPGDLVRETSDTLSKCVWKGLNKDGTSVVIDRLEIPVHEVLRRNDLVQINLIHNPLNHKNDPLGVHYIVSAITVEIDT